MILDMDIGNSRAKWRLAAGGAEVATGVAPMEGFPDGVNLPEYSVRRVRVSCVAGPVAEQAVARWAREHLSLEPEFARVVQGMGGVRVAYEDPKRLGVDRWLAMLGAYQKVQGACVVVDAGSAITADFLSPAGGHLGGLIAPGAQVMHQALFRQTHAVKVDPLTLPQKLVPGCDTLACVENGVTAALTGFFRQAVTLGQQFCGDTAPIIVTGGDAAILAASEPRTIVQPELVLDGLAVALPDS